MSEEIEVFKILNYDKFKCTADKCKFTCCSGWDVSIDADTYNKWENEKDKFDYILNKVKVKVKKYGSKTEYFMGKETVEDCPFLDKEGLCQIVKSSGEDCLSLTCGRFPRIENIFGDRKELSLSCACPEVVEIMGSIDGKIDIISEKDDNLKNHLLELRIREGIINIINQEKFSLEYKLIISFEMLLTILEDKNLKEDNLLEKIEKYNKREYIEKNADKYKEIDFKIDESIEEINYLFL
ncbi:MAG: flagellin lysine-N-methylase, partial [Clostridium sp.]